MDVALRLIDETSSGERTGETVLRLASERITVRELIERRVRQEVAGFHAQESAEVFRGLIQPTGAERTLNGFKVRKDRVIDPEEQVRKALAAFQGNGFLLLVDDEQVDDPDAERCCPRGGVARRSRL